MLHAILHGKLDEATPEPERREDALTSTVFGTLVWLEQWDLLERWLLDAAERCPDGDHAADTHDVWFWPRMANGVEPDVILRLGATLVVAEAKYRSGRSDSVHEDDSMERPRDQLMRQHESLWTPSEKRALYPEPIEEAIRSGNVVQAFVVDGSKASVRREYQESKDRLALRGVNLRLAKWQDLYRILRDVPPQRRWARELRAYLESVKLDPFEGIPRRMPDAHEIHRVRGWRSRRTASGLRTIIDRFGQHRLQAVIEWRTQGVSLGLREVGRRMAGVVPVGSVWRVARTTVRLAGLNLGGVACAGLDKKAVRSLLDWRLRVAPQESEGKR